MVRTSLKRVGVASRSAGGLLSGALEGLGPKGEGEGRGLPSCAEASRARARWCGLPSSVSVEGDGLTVVVVRRARLVEADAVFGGEDGGVAIARRSVSVSRLAKLRSLAPARSSASPATDMVAGVLRGAFG